MTEASHKDSILVTGAGGQIVSGGRQVAEMLLERGFHGQAGARARRSSGAGPAGFRGL